MMPPPTTARGMLGHFLCVVDPPATYQCDLPPPVRARTYFSLQAILTAKAGGGSTQGETGRCRRLRDVRGGGG